MGWASATKRLTIDGGYHDGGLTRIYWSRQALRFAYIATAAWLLASAILVFRPKADVSAGQGASSTATISIHGPKAGPPACRTLSPPGPGVTARKSARISSPAGRKDRNNDGGTTLGLTALLASANGSPSNADDKRHSCRKSTSRRSSWQGIPVGGRGLLCVAVTDPAKYPSCQGPHIAWSRFSVEVSLFGDAAGEPGCQALGVLGCWSVTGQFEEVGVDAVVALVIIPLE
jgi:hypothetical protein